MPPRKRLCIALGPRYEVGESSSAPKPTRGFRTDYGFVATLDDEIRRDLKRYVGYGITDTWDDMIEDMLGTPAATDVAGLSQSLMSGRLNMLFRDRRAHAHTALLMEREVEIGALRTADRTRQAQLVETLRLVSSVQTQATALQRQQGPARGLAHPEIPEEAVTPLLISIKKMAPKRTTRANPADNTATTSVTNAQLKEMIDQGVTDALAARDADRNTNGDDSHNSRTGVRRTKRVARECTYSDFMKCQPLNFKGTEGVIELIQ
ncbi:hypothetical protein Tco_1550491 [Tanacetum coccineum]